MTAIFVILSLLYGPSPPPKGCINITWWQMDRIMTALEDNHHPGWRQVSKNLRFQCRECGWVVLVDASAYSQWLQAIRENEQEKQTQMVRRLQRLIETQQRGDANR